MYEKQKRKKTSYKMAVKLEEKYPLLLVKKLKETLKTCMYINVAK